jgi:DNA-binding Lrp family transcriptional regulator
MMPKQPALRPVDLVVALGLSELPGASYEQLHNMLGISASTAHDAVRRLRGAGLVRQNERAVVRPALLEFLIHGARYAFPATLGVLARGVPTSHVGPALAGDIASDDPIVWPTPAGSIIGSTMTPLIPQATQLPRHAPGIYALLTLVDALRVGRARERRLAADKLRARLYSEPSTVSQATTV